MDCWRTLIVSGINKHLFWTKLISTRMFCRTQARGGCPAVSFACVFLFPPVNAGFAGVRPTFWMLTSGEAVLPGGGAKFLSAPPTSGPSPELKPRPAAVFRGTARAAHAANTSYEIISIIFTLSSHTSSIVASHHSCWGWIFRICLRVSWTACTNNSFDLE